MATARPEPRTNGASTEEARQIALRSKVYPRYSLQRAEEFTKVAFDEGPWRVDQDNVAQKVGYTNARNGAYKSLRATASYFGLITYENEGSLSVTQEWIDVLSIENPDKLRRARQAAMRRPNLYQLLLEDFANRQLPSAEKLEQQLFLNPKYGIVKDAAEGAAKAFLESAALAGMIDDRRYLRLTAADDDRGGSPAAEETAIDVPERKTEPRMEQSAQATRPNDSAVIAAPVQDGSKVFIMPPELDRLEVQLRNGKRAFLFVPVPLSMKDKQRLKGYIDLILDEEDVEPTSLQPAGAGHLHLLTDETTVAS